MSEEAEKQSREKLNSILTQAQSRSPFGWSQGMSINHKPLLLLIDADSLSEEQVTDWLLRLHAHHLVFEGWICANRPLQKVNQWLFHHELDSQLKVHRASEGVNEADRFLIEQGKDGLKSDRFGAILVCSLDRDLLSIIERWRLAGKPSFFIPLRTNESGQGLIQYARRLGVNLISPEFDPI